MNEIAGRIKRVRIASGITQEVLSDCIGISSKSLRRYESGQLIPGVNILQSITNYFGISIEYFLGLLNYYEEADFEARLDKSDNQGNNIFSNYVHNIHNHIFEDDEYYWVLMDRRHLLLGGYTSFTRDMNESKRSELKKLKPIITYTSYDVSNELNNKHMVINNELDLESFTCFGEQGIMKKSLCESILKDYIYYLDI